MPHDVQLQHRHLCSFNQIRRTPECKCAAATSRFSNGASISSACRPCNHDVQSRCHSVASHKSTGCGQLVMEIDAKSLIASNRCQLVRGSHSSASSASSAVSVSSSRSLKSDVLMLASDTGACRARCHCNDKLAQHQRTSNWHQSIKSATTTASQAGLEQRQSQCCLAAASSSTCCTRSCKSSKSVQNTSCTLAQPGKQFAPSQASGVIGQDADSIKIVIVNSSNGLAPMASQAQNQHHHHHHNHNDYHHRQLQGRPCNNKGCTLHEASHLKSDSKLSPEHSPETRPSTMMTCKKDNKLLACSQKPMAAETTIHSENRKQELAGAGSASNELSSSMSHSFDCACGVSNVRESSADQTSGNKFNSQLQAGHQLKCLDNGAADLRPNRQRALEEAAASATKQASRKAECSCPPAGSSVKPSLARESVQDPEQQEQQRPAPCCRCQPGQACNAINEHANRNKDTACHNGHESWSARQRGDAMPASHAGCDAESWQHESDLITSRLRLFEQRPASKTRSANSSSTASTVSSAGLTSPDEEGDADGARAVEEEEDGHLDDSEGEGLPRLQLNRMFKRKQAHVRPNSRCSTISISTTATSTSSAASFDSSEAALSTYTTSSISLMKPCGERAKDEQQAIVDDNNNSSACADAYAPTLACSPAVRAPKASPPSPLPPTPPPPPPPPPPMSGLTDFKGLACPPADSLRQAMEQRQILRDTSNLDHDKQEPGRDCDSGRLAASKLAALARAPRLSSQTALPMATFIPPKFSAPPKDGANIKPSEYLKRFHSHSALVTIGVTPARAQIHHHQQTKADPCASTASSSGVSSKSPSSSSTPIGSLSSSTGASLIARSSLASSLAGQQQRGRLELKGSFVSAVRHQPAGANRLLRQYKQRQSPFHELNRSQSTSALNKLIQDRHDDDTELGQRDNDSNQEGSKVTGNELDDDYDKFPCDEAARSTVSSVNSSASSSSSSYDHDERDNGRSLVQGPASAVDKNDDIASNLMMELRKFDKSKLVRSSRDEGDRERDGSQRHKVSGSHKLEQLLDSTKRDLIAELKETKDLDGIKRMRETYKNKTEFKQVIASAMPVFKAENFLDQVAENEPELPLWRRQMLAKKAADRARKEHEEKLRIELEEKRLSQVPQWKRQMMAKKAAERHGRQQTSTDKARDDIISLPCSS